MYADEVAQVALEHDSNNARARFIRGLLGPVMSSRGILKRIKPLMMKTPKGRQDYAQLEKDSSKWPNHALKTFLFAGEEDIKSEKDAQNYLGQTEKKYQEFRSVLQDLRETTLTINIPELWQEKALESKASECVAEKVGDGQYEVDCDLSQALQITMNVADFDAARHIVAGLEIYQILLNSYNYSGVIEVSERFKGTNPSASVVYNELLKDQTFGTVRSASSLRKVVDMGLDAVAGIKWAQANQRTLCPKGEGQKNRPGYVFENGICVRGPNEPVSEKDTFGTVLATIELALRGGTIIEQFGNDETGRSIHSEIKPASFFINPILDVRDLGAVTFDRCDQVRSIQDSTFSGVFVNGDFNEVLSTTSKPCWN